jgi:hypothetical protein
MGLDMYLNKHVYVGAEYEHRKVTGTIDIKIDGKPLAINFDNVSYIVERAGYWRKANAIHKWFVANVQNGEDDCQDYNVDASQLKELLGLVNKVLDSSKLVDSVIANGYTFKDGVETPNFEAGKIVENPEVAQELLPASSGFFFGSTDYDQWYIEDLKLTKTILEKALTDEDAEYYYSSSW